jgi:hypothetical protein
MGLLSWLYNRSMEKRLAPYKKAEKERQRKREEECYQEWLKNKTCCRCGSTEDVIQKFLGGSETQMLGRYEAYCWRCDPYRGCLDRRYWPEGFYPYEESFPNTNRCCYAQKPMSRGVETKIGYYEALIIALGFDPSFEKRKIEYDVDEAVCGSIPIIGSPHIKGPNEAGNDSGKNIKKDPR